MSKPTVDMADSDAIMTVRDVAQYLKLSEATVYRWAKAKKMPAIRIERSWRFRKLDIDEWMREQSKSYAVESW